MVEWNPQDEFYSVIMPKESCKFHQGKFILFFEIFFKIYAGCSGHRFLTSFGMTEKLKIKYEK